MNNPKNRWTRKKPWILIFGCIILFSGLWHLVTTLYPEEEKELRRQFRETVKNKFPEQTTGFFQTFGLFYFGEGGEPPGASVKERKSVVLVHGLDDPGKVWQVLAPELVKEEFNVWLLNYPNDQPIVESARMFLDALRGLAQIGVERISIVAHSMGGLVSREMLTSPVLEYNRLTKKKHVPEVATLIMVGTPNHGSQLARFQVLSEIRDHLTRLTVGEANWLGIVFDGAGEAKIDLLPESRFLNDLNDRPHPEGVNTLIIAGITSPWNESEINHWLGNLRQKVSKKRQKQVDALGAYMISMAHGLGDGLVSVESTRLEGVTHRTVDGTHLSMIRNVTRDSGRIPPAVPIIVQQLKREE